MRPHSTGFSWLSDLRATRLLGARDDLSTDRAQLVLDRLFAFRAEPDQRLLTERKRFEFRVGKFVHHVRPYQLDRPVDNRRRQQFVDYLQKPRVEVAAAITQLFIGTLEQRVVVEVERDELPGIDLAQHAQIVLVAFGVALVEHQILIIDRKSVVWGQSGSVRVDLGGRRVIKKKQQ